MHCWLSKPVGICFGSPPWFSWLTGTGITTINPGLPHLSLPLISRPSLQIKARVTVPLACGHHSLYCEVSIAAWPLLSNFMAVCGRPVTPLPPPPPPLCSPALEMNQPFGMRTLLISAGRREGDEFGWNECQALLFYSLMWFGHRPCLLLLSLSLQTTSHTHSGGIKRSATLLIEKNISGCRKRKILTNPVGTAFATYNLSPRNNLCLTLTRC